MRDILAVGREIGRVFKPRRVILFGSHARGAAGPDSDVDLLVIMPHAGDGPTQATAICQAVDIPFPLDMLVRSPAEIRRRVGMNDFFIKEILREGKVIYEAGNRRVGSESRRGLSHHAARLSRQKVSKP
ncbi:MAG: nucleotidyltransferase domain-containing protein [Tepidisphaeraceae bacterium]